MATIHVVNPVPKEVQKRLLESPACEALIRYMTERGAEAHVVQHLVLWMWNEGYEFTTRKELLIK
jgi:hypothetical protein